MTKRTYSWQNMGKLILHWEDGPPPWAKCTWIYEVTCQWVICTCQNFFSSLTWLKESLFRVSSRYLQKEITSQGCQTQQCPMQKLRWEGGNRNFSFLREKYIWNIWTRIKWEAKLKKSIWNILTLLKWEAKLAHWSGTKWTDSMFYITTDWKSITNREKWKSEKRDKYSFTSQIRRLIQNIWNLIFSDFDSTFLLLGGVCKESA